MIIKLNCGLAGIFLVFAPLCYPETQPNGYTDLGPLAASRMLQNAIESADDVILYSLDPERADVIYRPREHSPRKSWRSYSMDSASLVRCGLRMPATAEP